MSYKKESFFFNSSNPGRKIHADVYIPDGDIKAVLQISHGMVEFIGRYENFAGYLAENGFVVTGNDHLGHGDSVITDDDFGYFRKEDGNGAVLEDLHTLTKLTKERFPGKPYFLLGHSMGSFYARQYMCKFGGELSGCIVMGTGYQARPLVIAGIVLTEILKIFRGDMHRSKFVDSIAFGGYNKRFEPARTKSDWLTKDEKIVDAYISDKRCSFIFTLNGYNSMFRGINNLYKKDWLSSIPKSLPVLFVSGADDPVGEFTKGVLRAKESVVKAGVKDVSIKFYESDRHEILNETDRDVVYSDILAWLVSKI